MSLFYSTHLFTGLLVFIIVVPFILKRYTKNLQIEIAKKTALIQKMHQELQARHNEIETELNMARNI